MSRLAGPCLPPTAAIRLPSMATSPVKAALPVPSTMVPPRMTISCMGAAPASGADDAPAATGAQRPARTVSAVPCNGRQCAIDGGESVQRRGIEQRHGTVLFRNQEHDLGAAEDDGLRAAF